jgi:acetyl/propionyl-CoA carboxylase alpha subunit
MIGCVLIANRGEIARRVIRACRAMGIGSVAVYSDADAGALHVSEADTAVPLPGVTSTETYLSIPRLIAAAGQSGADAVHPGYGFLSENAAFAEACVAAGLVFVGPPAPVIRRMGSKSEARAAVAAAGVPVVPGLIPRGQDDEAIRDAIAGVGLPALLKATAGGGGKGMRIVRSLPEADAAIEAARREATRAFGDGTLYVERLVESARHVEVQVLADSFGRVIHLFERDCSLQRRHQKVVEEAPAVHLTARVRDALTRAAVEAAAAVGYVSAGTVECLLEGRGDDARFYFLEMNTRLQVEHPVTEALTGIDLVRAQIEIASGLPLPWTQAEIHARGHAIECRVYAEDSERLLPQTGTVRRYQEPGSPGVRVDSAIAEGQAVTVHYDPLLAKVIVHAPDRPQALSRMRQALAEYAVLGVRHNIGFLRRLLDRPEVGRGETTTGFIESNLAELTVTPESVRDTAALAAAWAAVQRPATKDETRSDLDAPQIDPWDTLGGGWL